MGTALLMSPQLPADHLVSHILEKAEILRCFDQELDITVRSFLLRLNEDIPGDREQLILRELSQTLTELHDGQFVDGFGG